MKKIVFVLLAAVMLLAGCAEQEKIVHCIIVLKGKVIRAGEYVTEVRYESAKIISLPSGEAKITGLNSLAVRYATPKGDLFAPGQKIDMVYRFPFSEDYVSDLPKMREIISIKVSERTDDLDYLNKNKK